MAIGRLSVVVGVKGKGGPHAQYIAREGKYAKHNDGLEKLEGTGHGNMPKWAQADPNFFWKMSDDKERKNGTSYREHIITLPRELTADQRHELIKEWIHQEIGEKHAYQYAIHNPLAMDGLEQPHAHIMFSERLIDGIERDPDQYFKRFNAKKPESGGAKKANTPKFESERKLELKDQRDRWEKLCNSHLELAGSDARISMKSLKEQGIDREPINLSMQQIKRADVKEIYTNLLTARNDFEQAKLDSLAINIIDELGKIDKESHERASTAIDRANRAIGSSERAIAEYGDLSEYGHQSIRASVETDKSHQRIIGYRSQRIDESYPRYRLHRKRVEETAQTIDRAKRRISDTKQFITSSKRRIIDIKQFITSSEQRIRDRKQLLTNTIEEYDRLIQGHDVQTQAREQQRQQELTTIQAEEKEAERQRIEKRKPSGMIRTLGLRIQIGETDKYGNITLLHRDVISHVSVEVHELIKNAIRGNHQTIITNTSKQGKQLNPEYAQNGTARAFEKFMLDENVLSNPRILIDFGLRKASEALGIREFAEKYDIKCDFHDLEKLDSLNPVVNAEPKIEKPAQQSSEPKPQNDSPYDNSLNYP